MLQIKGEPFMSILEDFHEHFSYLLAGSEYEIGLNKGG